MEDREELIELKENEDSQQIIGACEHEVAEYEVGEPSPSEYDETDPSQLPIAAFRNEIVSAMRLEQPVSFSPPKNRVLVCTGETGSGKTTQIPQVQQCQYLECNVSITYNPHNKRNIILPSGSFLQTTLE